MLDPQFPGKENAPQYLRIPLEKFTPHWPSAIREELALHPFELTLTIPMDELEEALRHGKVKFPWERLRAWINPPLKPGITTDRGNLQLELPLPVVVPLVATLYGNG